MFTSGNTYRTFNYSKPDTKRQTLGTQIKMRI